MTRLALILPAALLCLAAAPAQKAAPSKAPAAKAAPAKPATTPAAAKPAPAKAASDGAAFDATNPQALMAILSEAGAKVQTSRREDDAVFVAVTSTAAAFSMQFAGCSP